MQEKVSRGCSEPISRSIAVIVWDGNIYKLEADPSCWRELLA